MKKTKMILVFFLAFSFLATGVFADVALHNKDSKRYYYMANTSNSCFSGGVTSYIGPNTSSSVPAGWFCLNKEKPAVLLKNGEKYIIQNGVLKKD
ncbi:MAG: hypothetical protein OEV44_06965 [Spirochaetota bacterium]|nr:hypothetical protein [Spirochaetota bacterium]